MKTLALVLGVMFLFLAVSNSALAYGGPPFGSDPPWMASVTPAMERAAENGMTKCIVRLVIKDEKLENAIRAGNISKIITNAVISDDCAPWRHRLMNIYDALYGSAQASVLFSSSFADKVSTAVEQQLWPTPETKSAE